MSIGYLPILNTFIFLLNCTNNGTDIVHSEFKEVVCWQKMHILHSIVGIIMSLFFTIFVFVLNLIFFESKTMSRDPTCKFKK